MPIYEFQCGKCGHEYEELTSMSAANPPCPKCGGASERLLSGAHFGVKTKVGKKAMLHDAKRSAEKAAANKPKS